MKEKKRPIDSDLRTALQRRYADAPVLPEHFANKVIEKMQKNPKPASTQRKHWRAIAVWCVSVAALVCLLLLNRKPVENHLTDKLEVQSISRKQPIAKTEPESEIVAPHKKKPVTKPIHRKPKPMPRIQENVREESIPTEATNEQSDIREETEKMLQTRFESGEYEARLLRENLTIK